MIWTLTVADLHAGSDYALIPPGFIRKKLSQSECDEIGELRGSNINDWRNSAIQFWNEFEHSVLPMLPKCKTAFLLSDNIEGSQHKSGGAQLISPNCQTQSDIAVIVLNKILRAAGNPSVYGVRGTGYHVTESGGRENDDTVYDRLDNMKGYDDVMAVERYGHIYRLQHFVQRSSMPYGKHTALARQMITNTLGAAMEKEHDADIMLFGHVHYCVGASFPMSNKHAFTCPCLKLRGEAYGRTYNDFYDVGILLIGHEKEGSPIFTQRIKIKTAYQKPKLWK